ncbi:hypothetical protein CMQ_1832 [Grosmannia clavigera kw1407]|uniref:Uncharacterized protein n=1 Tax=Grosmannia clavigera (strain kw1407 / UAMH 11150) TaxID=655863 RepID=F0XRL4_GROCL|nr:uncharacterized protein CMQ_1832 [Grosmannia clavigera kw1407]EFW99681.1 hypothetical protein CMQ_1832 [Grosmannia clavigera kw1407]
MSSQPVSQTALKRNNRGRQAGEWQKYQTEEERKEAAAARKRKSRATKAQEQGKVAKAPQDAESTDKDDVLPSIEEDYNTLPAVANEAANLITPSRARAISVISQRLQVRIPSRSASVATSKSPSLPTVNVSSPIVGLPPVQENDGEVLHLTRSFLELHVRREQSATPETATNATKKHTGRGGARKARTIYNTSEERKAAGRKNSQRYYMRKKDAQATHAASQQPATLHQTPASAITNTAEALPSGLHTNSKDAWEDDTGAEQGVWEDDTGAEQGVWEDDAIDDIAGTLPGTAGTDGGTAWEDGLANISLAEDSATEDVPGSADAETTTEDEERTPQQIVADAIISWFRGTLACPQTDHDAADKEHTEGHKGNAADSRCYSLADIANVLSGGVGRSNHAPDVLSCTQPPFSLCEEDLEGSMQRMFKGKSSHRSKPPPSLCMAAHYSGRDDCMEGETTRTSFDIDSITGFADDLSFCRVSLKAFVIGYPDFNITKNVHLTVSVPSRGNGATAPLSRQAPLYHVPHMAFADLEGWDNMRVYVYFPRLYKKGTQAGRRPLARTMLSREQLEQWFNQVFFPSVQAAYKYDANMLEHWPLSYKLARMAAYAKVEERKIPSVLHGCKDTEENDYTPRQIITRFLQSWMLPALARELRRRVACNAALDGFADFGFYFAAKNIKCMFMRSTAAASGVQDLSAKRDTTFSKVADTFKRYNVLLKSLSPSGKSVRQNRARQKMDAAERQRLVERGRTAGDYAAGAAPSRPPTTCTYLWAGTRDAGALTLEAAPNGADRRLGLVYTQCYNASKAPFDAQKIYALQGENIETLAFDSLYLTGMGALSGASRVLNKQSAKTATTAYERGKKRACEAVENLRTRSYGVRQEHRISLSLFRTMRQRVVLAPPTEEGGKVAYSWLVVPGHDIYAFLHKQINRHCLAFKRVRQRAGETYSFDETAVMLIMLRLLRYSYSTNAVFGAQLLFGNVWVRAAKKKSRAIAVDEALLDDSEAEPLKDYAQNSKDDSNFNPSETSAVMHSRLDALPAEDANSDSNTDSIGHDGLDVEEEVDEEIKQSARLGLMVSIKRYGFAWWQPGKLD